MLGRALVELGCTILDWTEWAVPPQGLTPQERRQWMDTDLAGGKVYEFCKNACREADLVIYYGASGQDAGVETGMASAAGVPILGIEGPLEAPGLMLNGAVNVWAHSMEEVLEIVASMLERIAGKECGVRSEGVERLLAVMRARRKKGNEKG